MTKIQFFWGIFTLIQVLLYQTAQITGDEITAASEWTLSISLVIFGFASLIRTRTND